MKKFSSFFEGKRPSVKQFYKLIAPCTEQVKTGYIHEAYEIALKEWANLPKCYQIFFRNLIKDDYQRFLDYLHGKTVLGSLRYVPEDPEMFRKVVHLLVKNRKEVKSPPVDLLFSLLAGFDLSLKASSLRQYMRTDILYPDDLLDLLAMIQIR